MVTKIHTFDAARSPLQKGVSLVEASAGTGKTYAIAMLVLRSVVELEIDIDRILIVTFTKAATEELRGRIRARLVEGRDLLAGTLEKPDPTLAAWGETVSDKEAGVRRLQLALYDIDRAGIFTIHSFCQRMLVDQALESGQLFDVELQADISSVRSEVVDDFWRNHFYSLDALVCSILLAEFANPEVLLDSVRGAINGKGRIDPDPESIESAIKTLTEAFNSMSDWWQYNGEKLLFEIESIRSEKGFKKKFTESFESWSQSLNEFFSAPGKPIAPDLHLLKDDEIISELNGTKYRGDSKKLSVISGWTMPGKVIDSLIDAIEKLVLSFRGQLALVVRSEVEIRMNARGLMSFDDLISRLSAALESSNGRGHELRRIIRERFSVALIDEFQDTDSSQWHIFSELFACKTHYLYLIGDPKQAIYKFRGADIYSYFKARRIVDHNLTLEKNYRSHPFLVEEVNSLFSSRSQPFFFSDEEIDYNPVQPAKSIHDIDLLVKNDSLAGMIYCALPANPDDKAGRWTSGKAATLFRTFISNEIAGFLGADSHVILKDGEKKNIQPKDIAILVRSNRQAGEYLQELYQAGIPAVVAGRESVFNSEECRELFLLLTAIEQPTDISFLKSAMTISWFGFTGDELYEIWGDEEKLSKWNERFLLYSSLWQKSGFMVMINRLIVDEQVYINLTSLQGTERSITNIGHLTELIQEAELSGNYQSGHTLLWLSRMMNEKSAGESGELRLESDEEAVQIITMHGAKGLEYPVVFCPYLWYRSDRLKNEKYCIVSHDDNKEQVVDLGSPGFDARREKAMEEELAEDLRLLYVALTRSAIRCYTMWADVKKSGVVGDSFSSALGYLLFPTGQCSLHEQQAVFLEMEKRASNQFHLMDIEIEPMQFEWHVEQEELTPLIPSGRRLHTDWQMSSYSSLSTLSEYDDELLPPATKLEGSHLIPVTGLPAGPNFGNVVHDMLESVPFADFQNAKGNEQLLQKLCKKYGVSAEPEPLLTLLKNVVMTSIVGSLVAETFALASLDESSCLKEMEFYFHMSRTQTEMINKILSREPTVCRLSHRVMQGYLTGLMDLVCMFEGRYYILDYKTNYLGDKMADYSQEKLSHGMRSHNYGLQFWIYTLVLHRHLKSILPDYRYEDHFGGVFYLFVRGMSPASPGSGVFSTLPDLELLEQLDQIFGGSDGE